MIACNRNIGDMEGTGIMITLKTITMTDKTLLTLFDYSGIWALPFHNAGWNVIQIDLEHNQDILQFKDVQDVWDWGIGNVDGIIAAPPCTDYSVSGAQYWKKKDKDGRTETSNELVRQVLRLVNLFTPTDPDFDGTFFWALENPVGRINKIFPELGKPWYFDPYEFSGYVTSKKDQQRLQQIRKKKGINVTDQENDFVIDCEAYTKKTALYGDFNNKLVKKIIDPVRTCNQGSPLMRLGGNSKHTKKERSYTPYGFAAAFYQANKNYIGTWKDELTY